MTDVAPAPRMHGLTHVPGGPDPIPGLVLAGGGSYRETVLAEPSLVAYWPMDDASGNAVDASGGGHDLAPTGSPTYGLPGPFPSAPALTSIGFDGGTTSGVGPTLDAFARLDDALDGYVSGHTGLTVEAWVYATAVPTSLGGIVGCQNGQTAFVHDHRDTGKVLWQGDSPAFAAQSTPSLNLSEWVHVVGTVDATLGAALYFNGTLVATGANHAPLDLASARFIVGARWGSPSTTWYHFAGRICQVALYSEALDAATILGHYTTGAAGGSGDGITSIGDTTPTSLTGVLKGNGTDVDVAVAGTDYATPAQVALKVDRDAVEAATARLVAVKLAAGDAQPTFRILGDGKHEWGPGGTTAPDASLFRSAATILATDVNMQVGGNVLVPTGRVFFGPSNDVSLYRPAASQLKTDADLTAASVAGPYVFSSRDTAAQIVMHPSGRIFFGDALDTSVYRGAAGKLAMSTAAGDRTIELGAPDSGGTGYRMLRVTN